MTKHGVPLSTLKECLRFLVGLKNNSVMQTKVVRKMHGKIKRIYTNHKEMQNKLKSTLSKFLIPVEIFYVKLVSEKIAKQAYFVRKNGGQLLDALLECMPKFLAALYFLWYNVFEGFHKVGGGKWKENHPGVDGRRYVWGWFRSGDWGGATQRYLRAMPDDHEFGLNTGVIPGGFEKDDLKEGWSYSSNGYYSAKDMIGDIKAILSKNSHNCFRDIFFTTVISDAGTNKVNLANVLRLVQVFCEMVEQDSDGIKLKEALEKDLKNTNPQKCINWSHLKGHCSKIKHDLDTLFAPTAFSYTGQAPSNNSVNQTEFAQLTADWFRKNLAKVRDHFRDINRVGYASGSIPYSVFATKYLFPYGFTFGENSYGTLSNASASLKSVLNSVIRPLSGNDATGGLIRLKNFLEGRKCKPGAADDQGSDEEAPLAEVSEAPKEIVTDKQVAVSPPKKAEVPPASSPEDQNQAKKSEGAQNQGKKAEGAQNQGKKSEGAQNQGKKAEGAQNQGKKSEGAPNNGQSEGNVQTQASPSSGDRGPGSGQESGGKAGSSGAGKQSSQKAPIGENVDTSSGLGDGGDRGEEYHSKMCLNGKAPIYLGFDSGETKYCPGDGKTWYVSEKDMHEKWDEWNRKREVKLEQKEKQDEEKLRKQKEAEEHNRLKEFRSQHPIIPATYYNPPPPSDGIQLPMPPSFTRNIIPGELMLDGFTGTVSDSNDYSTVDITVFHDVAGKEVPENTIDISEQQQNQDAMFAKAKQYVDGILTGTATDGSRGDKRHIPAQAASFTGYPSQPRHYSAVKPLELPNSTIHHGQSFAGYTEVTGTDLTRSSKNYTQDPAFGNIMPTVPPIPQAQGSAIIDPNKNVRLSPITKADLYASHQPPKVIPHPRVQHAHELTNITDVSGAAITDPQKMVPIGKVLDDLSFEVSETSLPTGQPISDPNKMSATPLVTTNSKLIAPPVPTKIYPPHSGQFDDQYMGSIPDVEGSPIKNRPAHIPTVYIPQDSAFETFVPSEPTGDPIADPKTKAPRKSLTPVEIEAHPGVMIDEPICQLYSPLLVTKKVPSTDHSIAPPRTVREMLCWLSDLPHALGYADLIKHIVNLFEGSESIEAIPESISSDDVTEALSQTCGHASSVLAGIQGPAPIDLNKLHYERYGAPLMYYSEDPYTLLCQLMSYVYATYHQLSFLRTQCRRESHQGGWRDCQFGKYIKASYSWQCTKDPLDPMKLQGHGCDPSPLQGFLTDQSYLSTYWYQRDDVCRRSRIKMGFVAKGFRDDSKHGFYIYNLLTGACYNNIDPLEKLCRYLVCLTRRTPRTTGELVSFFHNFGIELHGYASGLSPLGISLSTRHSDCPDWDHLGRHDLQAVKGIRGTESLISQHNSNHDKEHPRTLSTLLGCGSDNAICHPHCSPITYQAYSLYSQSFAHTYLGWTVYLPDRLWESLQKLHYELKKHVSTKCASLYLCPTALPLLYLHGFTPPEGTSQVSVKCSDVISKLEEIVNGKPIADLMTAMDNFLYGIREPFIFTLVTLWSIAFLSVAHTALYRLDALRIRSHFMRSRGSHVIDVKALLTDGTKMPSLYDIDYFDEDTLVQLVVQ